MRVESIYFVVRLGKLLEPRVQIHKQSCRKTGRLNILSCASFKKNILKNKSDDKIFSAILLVPTYLIE